MVNSEQLAEDEETWSDKDVILPTNAKSIMDRTHEQRGRFKDNMNYKETYIYNQTAESFYKHNEEKMSKDSKTYRILKKQRKLRVSYLTNFCEPIAGTESKRDVKVT